MVWTFTLFKNISHSGPTVDLKRDKSQIVQDILAIAVVIQVKYVFTMTKEIAQKVLRIVDVWDILKEV